MFDIPSWQLTPEQRIELAVTNLTKIVTDLAHSLERMEERMSQQLDALTAQVKSNTSLVQSAVSLINGLATKLEASKNDPVAIQALADEMKAQDDTLAAALTANTPAANTP